MMPSLKSERSETPDAIAPDGAEMRVLLDRPQGATRLSLAEALVRPGERTACVSHKTIELVCKVSGEECQWTARQSA